MKKQDKYGSPEGTITMQNGSTIDVSDLEVMGKKTVTRGIFSMSESLAKRIDAEILNNPDNQLLPEWAEELMRKQLEKMGFKSNTLILTSTPSQRSGFFAECYKWKQKESQ